MGALLVCCEGAAISEKEAQDVIQQELNGSVDRPVPLAPESADATWKIIVNKDGGGFGAQINTKRYRYDYVVIRRVSPSPCAPRRSDRARRAP